VGCGWKWGTSRGTGVVRVRRGMTGAKRWAAVVSTWGRSGRWWPGKWGAGVVLRLVGAVGGGRTGTVGQALVPSGRTCDDARGAWTWGGWDGPAVEDVASEASRIRIASSTVPTVLLLALPRISRSLWAWRSSLSFRSRSRILASLSRSFSLSRSRSSRRLSLSSSASRARRRPSSYPSRLPASRASWTSWSSRTRRSRSRFRDASFSARIRLRSTSSTIDWALSISANEWVSEKSIFWASKVDYKAKRRFEWTPIWMKRKW